jgi:hypothetical protein
VTMSDRNEILDIARDDTKGSAAGYGVEILGQGQCAAQPLTALDLLIARRIRKWSRHCWLSYGGRHTANPQAGEFDAVSRLSSRFSRRHLHG